MERRWIRRSGLALACGVALAGAPDARSEPGSEPFEVTVLRGAGVSRVTGSADGVVREEVLRENPARRAAEPAPAPRAPESDARVIVVVGVTPTALAVPLLLAADRFARHGRLGHAGRRHPHRVWRTDRSSQGFYHLRAHPRHAGRARGERP